MSAHHGIACIGSSVVDELVPEIEPGQLTYVDANKFVTPEELAGEELHYSVGGMALNVGVDLAKLDGGYPVSVFGKVGLDYRAEIVRTILRENDISDDTLIVDKTHNTSSTEVMHLRMPNGQIERFFRHTLGAMGAFSEKDIPVELLTSFKIALFGYGLLLPQLDLEDDEYGTVLGRVLAATQKLNVQTAMDFVSPNAENMFRFMRYRKTLNFVDIICINDDQACALTQHDDPEKACIALVEDVHAGIAAVHCGAEGPNYAYSHQDGLKVRGNFAVPEKEYVGNAGAGDAFMAGFLHSMHREWPLEKALEFAAAAAAVSLGDVSCTGAMKSEQEILNYIKNR